MSLATLPLSKALQDWKKFGLNQGCFVRKGFTADSNSDNVTKLKKVVKYSLEVVASTDDLLKYNAAEPNNTTLEWSVWQTKFDESCHNIQMDVMTKLRSRSAAVTAAKTRSVVVPATKKRRVIKIVNQTESDKKVVYLNRSHGYSLPLL